MRSYLITLSALCLFGCTGAEEPLDYDQLIAILESSESAWAEMKIDSGSTYTYSRVFTSETGSGAQTDFVVQSDILTHRRYTTWTYQAANQVVEWTEEGLQVGVKNGLHPALLIEELYEACRYDVLPEDPILHDFNLTFHDSGLLEHCHVYGITCVGDCIEGVEITAFEWGVAEWAD